MDYLSKQKLKSEFRVNCMTMQKSEQKKSRTKTSQAEVPRAEKLSK